MGRLGDIFSEFDTGSQAVAEPIQQPAPAQTQQSSKLGGLFDAFDTGEPEPVAIDEPVQTTNFETKIDTPDASTIEFAGAPTLPSMDFGEEIADPSDIGFDASEQAVATVTGKQRSGFVETLESEFQPLELTKKIPIVGGLFGLLEAKGTIDAVKRIKSGNYDQFKPDIVLAQERFQKSLKSQGFDPKELTEEEKRAAGIPKFHNKENDLAIIGEAFKRANKEFTFGGKVAKGLSILPTWMLEFAATGGLASLGDDVARKAGEKVLGKYVKTLAGKAALKTAGLTAGAVVRTSTGLIPRVVEKAADRQALIELGLKGEEGWATSFAKAWGDTAIESFSEETGGLITKGLSKGVSKLPFGGKFFKALRASWMNKTGGSAADFAKRTLTKAGYSNMLGEIGEERIGTILREATGVSDREGNIQTRIWEGLKEDFTPENLGAEAVVLAVPGLVGKGLSLLSRETEPITDVEVSQKEPEPSPVAETKEAKTAQIEAEAVEAKAKKALDVGQQLADQSGEAVFVQEGKILTSKPEGEFTEIKPAETEQPAAFQKGESARKELLEKARKIDAARDFTVTDVTPEGFGVEGKGTEDAAPSLSLTTEQQKLQSSINATKTILRSDLSKKRRIATEKQLGKLETRLENSFTEKQLDIIQSQKLKQEPIAQPEKVPETKKERLARQSKEKLKAIGPAKEDVPGALEAAKPKVAPKKKFPKKKVAKKKAKPKKAPAVAPVGPIGKPTSKSREKALDKFQKADEPKQRGLSVSIEKATVEKGLTEFFENIPEFQSVNLKDQAGQASSLIKKNPEQAKRIAMGQEVAPKGVIPEMVLVALSNKALQEGDVDTLRDIATASSLTTEATTMGQRIRALGELDQGSPIKAMGKVITVREKAFQKKNKKAKLKVEKSKEVAKIKESIKRAKAKSGQKALNDFISALEC